MTPIPDPTWRFALALCAHDVRSALTPAQRAWCLARLAQTDATGQRPPFTPEERERLTPTLLAWADQTCPRVGVTLRYSLGLPLTQGQHRLLASVTPQVELFGKER